MASSCKKHRPHHHDLGKKPTHRQQHHDHDDDTLYEDDGGFDQQQHRCSKTGNRFTTSSRNLSQCRHRRRLMHFHLNSSSLTVAAVVFMFVAVLLMPHHPVFAEETVSEIDSTTEITAQPTSLTQVVNIQNLETENHETSSINNEHTVITNQHENLNEDVVEVQPKIEQENIETVRSLDNNDQNTEIVKQPPVAVSHTPEEEAVIIPENDSQATDNNNLQHLVKPSTPSNTTIMENVDENVSQQSVEESTSPKTLNNENNSPHTSVNNDSQLLVHSQTSQTVIEEKKNYVSDENLAHSMPPVVDIESPIVEHHHHHEVNNDIYSSIVENHPPEIKTSPDFIDSQPGGASVPEATENLEQSIRQSVKTEIEMEQNLESSPVLDILKDIAEPDIRQTLTEDLIEPGVMNQNDFEKQRQKVEIREQQAEEIEAKEDQSEAHETQQSKDNTNGPATLGETNWVYLRGARNLALETNVNASLHLNESTSLSSSSSSSSLSASSSSESNSKETNGQVSHSQPKSNDITKAADMEDNSENEEKQNNAQEEYDAEESKADLTIPETSEEVHAAITTPTSDIAILDDYESENVAAETNDDALSVVLEESLSSTLPTNEEPLVNGGLINVEQKELKASLDDEEEDTTLIPEETEHNVIKKVLDEKEIFANAEEQTNEPINGAVDTEVSHGVLVDEPEPTIVEEPIDEIEPVEVKEVIEAIGSENKESQDAAEKQQELETESKLLHLDEVEKVESETDDEESANTLAKTEDREGKQLIAEVIVDDKLKKEQEEEEVEESNADENENKEENEDLESPNIVEDTFKIKAEAPLVEDVEPAQKKPSQAQSSTTESAYDLAAPQPTADEDKEEISSSSNDLHFFSSTEAASRDIVAEIPNADMDHTKTVKGSRSVNRALIEDDSAAATLFDTYPPHDSDQTFNGNLADESAGIGKALPVTNNEGGPNRSTIIIILSSGTACLFIIISVTFFLISFQRQHGTLDIEMQERSCGKDNLDEEDAETFAKLLEVELPPSVAIALEETEECL